jgi:hypothetical protein
VRRLRSVGNGAVAFTVDGTWQPAVEGLQPVPWGTLQRMYTPPLTSIVMPVT